MTQGSLRKYVEHNMTGHKMTISPDSKHTYDKFLMACSCGTEGRFRTIEEAKAYASMHATHYGIPLDELVISDKPTVYPSAPVAPRAPILPITEKVGAPAPAAVGAKPVVPAQPAKPLVPGKPDPNVGW